MSRAKRGGRCLLLEYLPDIHFQGSLHGVLLVVFSDGTTYLYPLSEETKDNAHQSATLLTQSSPKPFKARSANGENVDKYFLYDTHLELDDDVYRVHCFQFYRDLGERTVFETPRKVLLSPNKSLLLVHGAYVRGVKCLVVYQIIESFPNSFHLLFCDRAFSFVDACFSPDSRYLVCIPSRQSDRLIMLKLPLIECPHNANSGAKKSLFSSATMKKNIEHHIHKTRNTLAFEPRQIGPLCFLGPATDCFGKSFHMRHISSNHYNVHDTYHYVTWNDEKAGQYCLWNVVHDVRDNSFRHTWCPRLLATDVADYAWLMANDTPGTRILRAEFSPHHNGRLMMLVRHTRYGRGSDNGIGIQTAHLYPMDDAVPIEEGRVGGGGGSGREAEGRGKRGGGVRRHRFGVWYHLGDVSDEGAVLCCKWTKTLLLGSEHSAAALIAKRGLFELVSDKCGSAFQSLNESFTEHCTNFVQVGRYYRYWVSDSGELRAFVVTPQVPSMHPEWLDLVHKIVSHGKQSHDILNMRVLGKRIGYYIQDVEKEINPVSLELLYLARKKSSTRKRKKKKKKKQRANNNNTSSSSSNAVHDASPRALSSNAAAQQTTECYMGIHMHRCLTCKAVLLKPLLCGRCQKAVFCSKACLEEIWEEHRIQCAP